ncbi:MAG TPA: hypothetical protein VFG10_18940 [Saprospiraceae bacterium]|nr:hypothetical protein [Saprospiraceae bacterium]
MATVDPVRFEALEHVTNNILKRLNKIEMADETDKTTASKNGGKKKEGDAGNTPPTGFNRTAIDIRKSGKMITITREDLANDPALLAWLKEARPNLFS